MRGQQHHVLLVGGIFGEFISTSLTGSYMGALGPYFRKIFPGARITRYQPLFWHKRKKIIAQIRNIVFLSKAIHDQKIVIVAHSKGCADVLRFLIENSDLFESEVLEGVVLLSPPFRGSVVADKVHKWLGPLARFTSLDEVRTENTLAEEMLSSAKEGFLEAYKNKVVIVKSVEADTKIVPHPIKFIHWLMKRRRHQNDGLVPLESQSSPFQPKAEFLHARHHGYLSCLPPISGISKFERLRFFKSILSEVLQQKKLSFSSFSGVRENLNLKVGTYNAGLLPIPLFGVPYSKIRYQRIPDCLKETDLDILCLQEVFGRKPRELIRAELKDYVLLEGPSYPHSGLVTLIKRELIDDAHPLSSEYFRFSNQRLTEPLVGFEKGYLVTQFKLKNFSTPIRLLNVHLTAFGSAKKIRRKQLNQLFHENISMRAITFLCGDFNQEFQQELKGGQSYRASSHLNRIKPKWLREPSQRVDYVFPISMSARHRVSGLSEEILLQDPVVDLGYLRQNTVELSDHYLVKKSIRIEHQKEEAIYVR